MRLTDTQIKELLKKGIIKITPEVQDSNISGISLDVFLGNKFRVFNNHTESFIDLSGSPESIQRSLDKIMSKEIELSKDELFYLHPGQLALAVTKEKISLPPNIVGWLDGRSSLARLGLMVHATAHRIDPGWSGNIVLETYNCGQLPLALKPNMKIGALNFELLDSNCARPYNKRADSKYKNQESAIMSLISKDEYEQQNL